MNMLEQDHVPSIKTVAAFTLLTGKSFSTKDLFFLNPNLAPHSQLGIRLDKISRVGVTIRNNAETIHRISHTVLAKIATW